MTDLAESQFDELVERIAIRVVERPRAPAPEPRTTNALTCCRCRCAPGGRRKDSRVYRLRGGALVQLTKDHSVPEMPHVLTRAIGSQETIAVDTFTARIEPEDVFLLCTDGVTNVLPDPILGRLLGSARRVPTAAVNGILRAALPNARDNLTAIVPRIERRS